MSLLSYSLLGLAYMSPMLWLSSGIIKSSLNRIFSGLDVKNVDKILILSQAINSLAVGLATLAKVNFSAINVDKINQVASKTTVGRSMNNKVIKAAGGAVNTSGGTMIVG